MVDDLLDLMDRFDEWTPLIIELNIRSH